MQHAGHGHEENWHRWHFRVRPDGSSEITGRGKASPMAPT